MKPRTLYLRTENAGVSSMKQKGVLLTILVFAYYFIRGKVYKKSH